MAVVATLSKGYDLDYMWRQAGTSAGKEGAGNQRDAHNHLNNEIEIRREASARAEQLIHR